MFSNSQKKMVARATKKDIANGGSALEAISESKKCCLPCRPVKNVANLVALPGIGSHGDHHLLPLPLLSLPPGRTL